MRKDDLVSKVETHMKELTKQRMTKRIRKEKTPTNAHLTSRPLVRIVSEQLQSIKVSFG